MLWPCDVAIDDVVVMLPNDYYPVSTKYPYSKCYLRLDNNSAKEKIAQRLKLCVTVALHMITAGNSLN